MRQYLNGFLVYVAFATSLIAQEKARIFVTDSHSWEVLSGWGGSGERPQSAEIAKTIDQRCPELIVTIDRERADYILTVDHDGGKPLVRRDNKWALYNKGGDLVGSGSTRILGNSIDEMCAAIAIRLNTVACSTKFERLKQYQPHGRELGVTAWNKETGRNKEVVCTLLKNNGFYSTDPQAMSVWTYERYSSTYSFRYERYYAIYWGPKDIKYMHVSADLPKFLWSQSGGLTADGKKELSKLRLRDSRR